MDCQICLHTLGRQELYEDPVLPHLRALPHLLHHPVVSLLLSSINLLHILILHRSLRTKEAFMKNT